jgi:TonB family protein
MALSLALHCLFVLVMDKAIAPLEEPTLFTYRVELEGGHTTKGEALSEAPEIEDLSVLEAESPQDTISLDTKDDRYSAYARTVKERIWSKWKYPAEAAANGTQGVVEVLFGIGKDGRLAALKIISSSGHTVLDREVQEAVRRAGPFPPLPAAMGLARLNVRARFIYAIKSEYQENISN